MAVVPPPGASLANNTETEEVVTKIVSVWCQVPIDLDVLQFDFFHNVSRRVADRGTVHAFTYFNEELFYLMGTEIQAQRAFSKINNQWIMDEKVFVRCKGSNIDKI